MIGASAAMAISGVPFQGPIGAARVGFLNGGYVLNPTQTELKTSQLDLVVAGTQQAVLMVESEANVLSEDVMLGAVVYGHEQMQAVINMPSMSWWKRPASRCGTGRPRRKTKRWPQSIAAMAEAGSERCVPDETKAGALGCHRRHLEARARSEVGVGSDGGPDANAVGEICFALESKIVRGQILNGEPRIDGRDTRTVRPITIRNSVLPRTHGSALFTRGETQALVVATLGTARDEQIASTRCMGEFRDRFMLHYNMPPYATGETGRVGTPKRREIGHGRLAKRALAGSAAQG